MYTKNNECLAFVLMSASQILFPTSYIYISEKNLSMSQIMLFRGWVLFFICLSIAKLKNIDLQRSIRVNFVAFMIRNSIILIHTYAIVLCHFYLSVSLIHTINTIGTLFVFMWDYFIYKIRINTKQMIGISIGILGMMITVNSKQIYLMFDEQFESGSTFENYRSTSLSATLFFTFFLVFANIIWAYSASMVKSVKMKDSSEMNFHLSILFIFTAAINYCFFDIQSKSFEAYCGIIVFSSLPLGIGQVFFVMSLTLTRNTGVLTLFMSEAIIVGYCFSLIRYHENVNPIAVIGSILIISALTIVVLFKENEKKNASKI